MIKLWLANEKNEAYFWRNMKPKLEVDAGQTWWNPFVFSSSWKVDLWPLYWRHRHCIVVAEHCCCNNCLVVMTSWRHRAGGDVMCDGHNWILPRFLTAAVCAFHSLLNVLVERDVWASDVVTGTHHMLSASIPANRPTHTHWRFRLLCSVLHMLVSLLTTTIVLAITHESNCTFLAPLLAETAY